MNITWSWKYQIVGRKWANNRIIYLRFLLSSLPTWSPSHDVLEVTNMVCDIYIVASILLFFLICWHNYAKPCRLPALNVMLRPIYDRCIAPNAPHFSPYFDVILMAVWYSLPLSLPTNPWLISGHELVWLCQLRGLITSVLKRLL